MVRQRSAARDDCPRTAPSETTRTLSTRFVGWAVRAMRWYCGCAELTRVGLCPNFSPNTRRRVVMTQVAAETERAAAARAVAREREQRDALAALNDRHLQELKDCEAAADEGTRRALKEQQARPSPLVSSARLPAGRVQRWRACARAPSQTVPPPVGRYQLHPQGTSTGFSRSSGERHLASRTSRAPLGGGGTVWHCCVCAGSGRVWRVWRCG